MMLLLLASGLRGFAALPVVVAATNFPVQIVTCEDGVDVDALLKEHGVTPRHRYRYALNGFAAPLPPGIIEKLKHDKRVIAVEADGIASLEGQTVPTGVSRIGADMFSVGHGNALLNVDVAVLDSGIDPHEDLTRADGSSVVYSNYWAFGSDGSDSLGHGTAVVGVIAAQDNGLGVVGVAPGVRIWNVKCIGPAPYNTWNNVIKGIDFVTAHSNEISVANISIGNSFSGAPYTAIRSAVRRMVQWGHVVIVGSAGNDARDMAGADGVYGNGDDALPASIPDVMAVSAMDPATDTMAPFSNFSQVPRTNYVISPGNAIEVVAPGVNILTTLTNNSYGTSSGTSFAAPHVTGLVALYIAMHGRATNAIGVMQIRQAIVDMALAQAYWRTNHTGDPDTNPEPLAVAPQTIAGGSMSTNGFQVNFENVPGFDYTVQYADTLVSNPWLTLTNLTQLGNVTPLSITNHGIPPMRFYRLARAPAGSVHFTNAPAILTPLLSRQAVLGNTAKLSVTADPFTANYQWFFNGTPLTDNSRISGSRASILAIANAGGGDTGSYQVIITNIYGAATSSVAILTVVPQITNLVQNGSFESPQVSDYALFYTGDTIGGVWIVESTSYNVFLADNIYWSNIPAIPTPAGSQLISLDAADCTIRQDLAVPLSAGTSYNLSFLQSTGAFSLIGGATLSITATGSTNVAFTKTYLIPSGYGWARQQSAFTVPADGFYTLRLAVASGGGLGWINGAIDLDDISITASGPQ